MTYIQQQGAGQGAGRRAGGPRLLGALALMAAVGVAGCDSLLDVENPNNVAQEDVEQPQALTAMVNGAANRGAVAHAFVIRMSTTVSDETTQTGSWDAARDMNNGNLRDPGNADVNDGFNDAAVGRWMADETLALAQNFEQEGLARPADVMDAFLYAGLARLLIADNFEDFVYSNRTQSGPPIGTDNMGQVYDQALDLFTSMRTRAQAAQDTERQLQAAALIARTHWSKALWQKMHPRGNVPGDPLVNSSAAVSAVQDFFALNPPADWRFSQEYGTGSQQNTLSNWVNTRREIRPSDRHIIATAGSGVQEVILEDPIDGIVDPALSRRIWEVVDAVNWAPIPMVSTREMHLILAEAALAAGSTGEFENRINAVRALEEGLSPYTGQLPALDMLIHTREVNLYLQGRRLMDQYRFGIQSATWLPSSDAVTRPGSFFPIGEEERQTNCHFLGTC
jgi:starch-binding outer membrane protein, SusD/RagB family